MTVYVAQKRYTHEFMEKSKYFTVMQFSDADVIQYMGKHSGRDGDKAKALSLHVAYTKNGSIWDRLLVLGKEIYKVI